MDKHFDVSYLNDYSEHMDNVDRVFYLPKERTAYVYYNKSNEGRQEIKVLTGVSYMHLGHDVTLEADW